MLETQSFRAHFPVKLGVQSHVQREGELALSKPDVKSVKLGLQAEESTTKAATFGEKSGVAICSLLEAQRNCQYLATNLKILPDSILVLQWTHISRKQACLG